MRVIINSKPYTIIRKPVQKGSQPDNIFMTNLPLSNINPFSALFLQTQDDEYDKTDKQEYHHSSNCDDTGAYIQFWV